jgi:alkaline phosphatase D
MNRRQFVRLAGALGATAAWGGTTPWPSRVPWRERRDLYPEGVASGDPQAESVLLWTRYPVDGGATSARLRLEVAEDEGFRLVVATESTLVLA